MPGRGRHRKQTKAPWRTVAIVVVVIATVVVIAGPLVPFLTADVEPGLKAKFAGSYLLMVALAGGAIGIVFVVSRRSANSRSKDESQAVTSPDPVAQSVFPWYSSAVAALAMVVVCVLILLGLQIVGTFRPDLRAGTHGELYAPRTWLPLFSLICAFALRVLFRAFLRRKRMASSEETKNVNAMDSVMSVAMDGKWIAAVLLVAAVFGGLAVWASAWSPPALALFATDPAGNVYTVVGDNLYRWDKQGSCTLRIDLNRLYKPEIFSDLAVNEQGTIALSDSGAQRVLIIDSEGRLVREKPLGANGAFLAKPDDSRIGLSFVGGEVHYVHDGRVTCIDQGTEERAVFDDSRSKWASGVWVSDEVMILSDTSNRRLVITEGRRSTTLDCSRLAERYHYPDNVAMDTKGDLYVVVRKWWEDESSPIKTGKSEPKDPSGHYPDTWMGELYVLRKGSATLTHLPLTCEGIPVPVDDFGFLPSGKMLIMPLSSQVLCAFDPRRPEAGVQPWGRGQMKEVLDRGDMCTKLKDLAPNSFAVLAILFPIVIGICGALASADKTAPQTTATQGVPRVVY